MPIFIHRSPRIKMPISYGEFEIPKPPKMAEKPTYSFQTLLIPLITTIVGIGAIFYMSKSQGSSSSATGYEAMYMISYGTMLVSYTVPIFFYLSSRGKYKKALKAREHQYLSILDQFKQNITSIIEDQKKVLAYNYPDPSTNMDQITKRSSRLWERSSKDDDFLSIRIGKGQVPSSVQIKTPQKDPYEEDQLFEYADQIRNEFSTIDDAPIAVALYPPKIIGIIGDSEERLELVKTICLQISSLHSPDEVKLITVFPEHELEAWNWIRWIPHVWDDDRKVRYIADTHQRVKQLFDQLEKLMNRRKNEKDRYKENMILPAWVFILSNPELVENEVVYRSLLTEPNEIGATTIILANQKEHLPNHCNWIINISKDNGIITEIDTIKGRKEVAFKRDVVPFDKFDTTIRKFAPIYLRTQNTNEIPNLLTFTDLMKVTDIRELNVQERWAKNRYPIILPVPIGVKSGDKDLILNLHDKIEKQGHGPHGLLAGTTGSGKSEVIQSIILSLAVNYHPHDVVFMVIDYKGGGMANAFSGLPHLIATITNLAEGNIIDRARVSLKAELERRQRLLNEAGNLQHIEEYYQSSYREAHPLPHLLIIIDEFAELKRDQPDFMDELIRIAAIGRTLGVHLLLATQKPSGVVNDKIWSNSRFRICLRVQDEADSREMIKTPEAAWISTAGRGYLQVGTNEVFELFQSAWSGAPYNPTKDENEIDVFKVDINGDRKKIRLVETQHADQKKKSPKQIQVVKDYLMQVAEQMGIQSLDSPWSPPLPDELFFDQLIHGIQTNWSEKQWSQSSGEDWLMIPVGLLDDIPKQIQRPLTLNFKESNLLVYGMPGAGKTTFLQSLMTSFSLTHSPSDVHLYILDFGRMLNDYDKLPHVGDVITDEDTEKISRLFQYLNKELIIRKVKFNQAGVKTLSVYRSKVATDIPAIFVVIDNYLSFSKEFTNEHEQFEKLAREGGNFGIQFIVTANRISEVYDKIKSNFSLFVSLELADATEYYMVVGRPSAPLANIPAGRGFVKGAIPPLIFQTALPAPGEADTERTMFLRRHIQEMAENSNGKHAPKVPVLPEIVSLESMLGEDKKDQLTFALGLNIESLEPFYIDMNSGAFYLVVGRTESGKTSLLVSWVISIANSFSEETTQIYLLENKRTKNGISSLCDLPHVKGCGLNDEQNQLYLKELIQLVNQRNSIDNGDRSQLVADSDFGNDTFEESKKVFVFIDDFDVLIRNTSPLLKDIEYLVRNGKEKNVFFVISTNTENSVNFNLKWLQEIRRGFLLGTTEYDTQSMFGVNLSFNEKKSSLPIGEGLYFQGKHSKIKTAYPFNNDTSPSDWVDQIVHPMS